MTTNPLPIAVLISGNGSNLQAIIDAITNGLNATIKIVISNNADAFGLRRAEQAEIPTKIIDHTAFKTREAFDDALKNCIESYDVQLVVLAGFMRILSNNFVEHFHGRLINIHPSLLPKYPGLHTHEKVIENKDKKHGITIHFVTNDLDLGPIIAQSKLSVDPDDTAASLKEKIHLLEHRLYPKVLEWISAGRLTLQNDHVLIDGRQAGNVEIS